MLIKTLKDLRDVGNTVIVVEHDEDTIMNADYVINIGPGIGINNNKLKQIKKFKNVYFQYISEEFTLPTEIDPISFFNCSNSWFDILLDGIEISICR